MTRLEETLKEIRSEKEVFCIIATAGTTSTGAVDPIQAIKGICEKEKLWLHVDGAYGLAYSLVPEWQHLFTGFQDSDSVCWDPHKQLGVPIPNSILFLRDWRHFGRMAVHSGYFNRKTDVEPNPGLKSPPSTRPFSALALVTSLRGQGIKKIIERLRAPLRAIESLHYYLSEQSDFEVSHKPDTGIQCFRYIPRNISKARIDTLQKAIFKKIMSEGNRSISITNLGNLTHLRLLAISPCVTAEALIETIDCIRATASRL